MLICGKSSDRANAYGASDLRRPVRAAVQLEDLVVEVLDAQAQPGHADAANRRQLGFGDRSWLALERDFLGILPGCRCRQSSDQAFELLRREKRRRAAAEVHEVQLPSGDRRLRRTQLPFVREHVQVVIDFLRVLVGIHAEVAEVASLPAERDVQVEAERNSRHGRRLERHLPVLFDRGGRPRGERRIGGDEIAPDLCLRVECGRPIGHCLPLYTAGSAFDISHD